ncbi:MAG: hypothetical protein ACLTXT_05025 [Ruminococcus callidus]
MSDKGADQLRVAYPQTLSEMTVANGSSCQLLDSAGCRLYGNKTAANGQACRGGHPVQHPESDGTLLVKFGNLCFCVGTAVSYLPEEEVDALICTQWNGDLEQMPEETYEKDDAVQIRVYPEARILNSFRDLFAIEYERRTLCRSAPQTVSPRFRGELQNLLHLRRPGRQTADRQPLKWGPAVARQR